MSNTSSTSSIVKTLNTIVSNAVKTTLPTTISTTLLYKSGSDLTAISLGKLSN